MCSEPFIHSLAAKGSAPQEEVEAIDIAVFTPSIYEEKIFNVRYKNTLSYFNIQHI